MVLRLLTFLLSRRDLFDRYLIPLDKYYNLIPLNEDCVIPATPKKWYEWQRKEVYKEIKNDLNCN